LARILHLIAANHRRGAETFAVELAEHLRGRGHEVRVMAVVPGRDDEPFPVEVAGSRRFEVAGMRRVVQAARWSEVVVSFGSISLLTGAFAARVARRPFVYRNIGDPSVWGAAKLSNLRIGAPLRTAARLVALYPDAAETLVTRYRLDPARVEVIPRGVPEERFRVAADDDRDRACATLGLDPHLRWVAYVGALSPEKDPLLAVDALRHLDSGVGLVVAGGGPLEAEVRAAAADLGDRVRLLGVVDDVGVVYDAADALVLPSRTEGIPGAAVEASMCALPVATFAVGGTSTVVLDGVGGRLSPGRQPDVFAAAVAEVLEHRATWGPRARDHVLANFSMRSVGARWEALLAEVVARPARPRGRVLQVTASNERRGAELFAHQLGTHLGRTGWSVRTVSLASHRTPGGLPIHALGRGRFRPVTLARLVRAAAAADLMVVHGGFGLWPTAFAAAVTRRPFVYRGIGEPTYWGAVPFGKVRVGVPLRRADRVVALYPEAAEQFRSLYGLRPERLSVIPNGTDAEAYPAVTPSRRAAAREHLGLDGDARLVGYLGALSPEKRPAWAVRAMADLPDATLVLVGRGPLEAELRALAEQVAPGRVRFLGSLEEPADVLAGLDLLVLPSETEGMPATLIEAALMGIPTVATDVGAVARLDAELRCGTVVPADDEAAFRAAVGGALSAPCPPGPDREAAMAYDIAAVADRWAAELDGLLPARSRR